MSQTLIDLVEAYVDGDLDAGGAQRLRAAVEEGGAQAQAVREHLAFIGLVGQACDETGEDAVVRAVEERIDAAATASAFVAAVGHRIDRRPHHRPRRRHQPRRASPLPLALAALVLVTVTLGIAGASRSMPMEVCRVTAGTLAIVRDGERLQADRGSLVVAGDALHGTQAATLTFPDGTRLDLDAGIMGIIRDARTVHLDAGSVVATVARQEDGVFAITTAQARIAVLGTRFAVNAASDRTDVELFTGQVEVSRLADGARLILGPGESVEVAADRLFVVRGGEVPWLDLFADGLGAWRQQHGTWTIADGVVRGRDDHGGKVRLIGRTPVGDVEVDCEIRITGTTHGEIQVGDYNWFFTLPASGAWTRIHLRQQGQGLTCTADGRPLVAEAEAGAGAPMRPGPLSFYGGIGATVEIRQARIRIP